MKKNFFTSMGLMSGTSMDGVDISIIKSDGYQEFSCDFNSYYEYDNELYDNLTFLRDRILNFDDLKKYSQELSDLEKKFTILNGKIINDIIKKKSQKIDLIGFHGQTIFHLPSKKFSKQLGDAKLLSQLTKKIIINNFRHNDLLNGGQGAPLTPIFHQLISKMIYDKFNIKYPITLINIGGITNVTQIINDQEDLNSKLFAHDVAPGNCLIDEWVRKHSTHKFDKDGDIANSGKVDDLIFNQAIENFKIDSFDVSMDIKDFDFSFVRGLSFQDGCATLTKFTAYLISEGLKKIDLNRNINTQNYLVCGGGRKNKYLIQNINNFLIEKNLKLQNIDDYKFDGDFVESQAFAYLAIRSYLKLPISFPDTTRCKKAITGGEIIKNF